METARVEVKSAWLSKINWTAIIAAIVSLATANVLAFEPATQVKIMAVVTVFQSIATIVLKTWFTPTVTAASITAPTPGTE